MLGAAALAVVADPEELAGRYQHSFQSGDVSGDRFRVTDEIVIVPVDDRRAWIGMEMNFFNGHQCSLSGIAAWEGGELLYRNAEITGPEGQPCRLRIWRQGNTLRWDDGENSCRGYCGARGSLSDGSTALAGRRPLSRAERARLIREFERNANLP